MELQSLQHHVVERDIQGVTRGAQVTGVVVASLCLSWTAVIARFYVRIRLQRMFGAEDWLTAASMVVLTTLCALLLQSLDYGLGYHIVNVPRDDLQILSEYIFASELLYVITMTLTKLSIGFFYLRLARRRYQVHIIYAVMVLVMIYSLAYFIFLIFQCTPVSYFWNRHDGYNGRCLPKSVISDVTYVHAALSAITDWAFGLLPITFVSDAEYVQADISSASTATIVRIVYIHALEDTTDYTWEGINLTKWSIVEPAIAITAAGIATLRPLFQRCLHRRRFEAAGEMEAFDKDTDTYGSIRSTQKNSIDSEFAQMMGLRRIGVTTTIFADHVILSRDDVHEQGPRPKLHNQKSNESMRWLGRADSPVVENEVGIQTTTTISHSFGH